MIWSSCTVNAANTMRRIVAAAIPKHHDAPALLHGQAGDGNADDDGVVPGKHEVDDDDLRERRQLGHRDEIHSEVLCPFAGPASLPGKPRQFTPVARPPRRVRAMPPLPLGLH